MPRLRRAWREIALLSWPERRLLARAWLTLPAVAVGLRLLGFQKTQELLLGRTGAAATKASAAEARSAARLVDAAARWNPLPATCLVRSLVLCRLLRRLGLAADLRIGVAQAEGIFEAHAWVEHDGIALAEAGVAAVRYAPFDSPASHGSA